MSDDERFMRQALALAEQGRYSVSPNPMVGCVIVRDGSVVAEGWHRRAGEPHAEIEALRNSGDARGSTIYVTLEPCTHQGRTPPCVDELIAAAPARVVVAMTDPHEVVDGRGIERLREAGIEVTAGVMERDARRQNEKFIWAITQKLPFVLLKAAMTLDGKLATVTRDSRWITSEAAREHSLRLREEYDAIAVGSGTVVTDDPRLTRRLGLNGSIVPWTRVVFDGSGSVPPHAQVLTDGARTILFTSRPERFQRRDGLEIVTVQNDADLAVLLGELYSRGVTSVVAEGGSHVHSQLIRRGLWQKMMLFVAPMIIGGDAAPAIFSGEAVSRLTDAYRFRFDQVEMIGSDLLVTAYPA
ncbi:MAG TPA: bifunctional diaminohydroxyphosphoribosylaminopyrimidine deaminase/5-amino-6-(5-phosphoribosylamino)uracil reductase RibD [Thermoanaerobaculia bacterium]|nr:bifunctional diaminohydroxyphosphoribosylaminopyrimidine deaminase/5-amino-6-(5-phosphoribosylamino)uracil reductase RibD [Thermoanaerobaculia bacterium]